MNYVRATTTLLAIGALVAACARNPVTGERQLSLVSESQEIELGRQAAQQVRQTIGLVDDEALQSYVQRVGMSLAVDSERPDLPWTFGVVDDPTPNAFALPGGFIYVTRGMLNYMNSEAELAAVLGHEIGHVTARHSVQQLSRAQLAQFGLGLGMILFPEAQQLGGLFSTGLELLFLSYGRDAERQADELGFRYALDEGYDVREMDDIFATLQRIAAQEGRSPLPTWASSHPDPGERIEAVRARVGGLQRNLDALQVGRAEFLSQLDGLIWGDNPRSGFFLENVFVHPELEFRMSFPKDWRARNLPQAVIAGSPDQNAIVQLTVADGEPAAAARRFLAQQGIRGGQTARETINGLPAVLVRFAAQTQQGAVQGVVGFIAYRDRTYQIIGYAPASGYAEQEDAFLRTIGTFAPLTDPQVLAAQPPRMDIVRISRPMSLAEFAQAYPSTVDLETLLLINQVASADEVLPAGTLLKRVVAT